MITTTSSSAAGFRRALAIAAAVTALAVASIGSDLGGETAVLYVVDLLTVLAALAATVLSARAGLRHRGRLRTFWWLFAAGCCALTLGETVWAVYELVLGVEVPVPSWADAAYLASMPPTVLALLLHPGMRGSGSGRARLLLDALAVATALLFLSWSFVLGPLWRAGDFGTLAGFVTLAYPFGDVVVVFLVVLVVRRMTGEDRRVLWCLLGGLLAMALTDSGYAYLAHVDGYETGSLIDVGWIVAYIGIALGAFCAGSAPARARVPTVRQPGPAAVLVPFVPMLAALGAATLQLHLGRHLDRVGWSIAFALVALALARQALLMSELLASRKAGVSMSDRVVTALGGARPQEPPAPGAWT